MSFADLVNDYHPAIGLFQKNEPQSGFASQPGIKHFLPVYRNLRVTIAVLQKFRLVNEHVSPLSGHLSRIVLTLRAEVSVDYVYLNVANMPACIW